MKKVFLTFALILIAQIGFAQQQDEAFKKDVLKLIEANSPTASMKAMSNQILKLIPKDKQADFKKEFDALMPTLYEKIAKIYMETYTKEDVKAILAFYKTPAGKKMASKSDEIVEKCMAASQEWATDAMQDMMMRLMQ